MAQLLDQFGNPVSSKDLRREIAAPSLTGVRQTISEHPSVGLTPARLAAILRHAEDTYPSEYLALAEDMEEKEWHYMSVLGTRKRQVSQLEITVEPASDSADDQRNAELVQEFIDRGTLQDELFDILDAIGKGFSVTEILWDMSERDWRPVELRWRDPRWFIFDTPDRDTPRLRDDSGQGMDLAPFKFIVHKGKAKSGLAIRGGLARGASWAYLFKNFNVKAWVEFAEIFGQPLRVGKYEPGASSKDLNVLLNAVASIGRDAAAILPQNMLIEFIEAQKGGSTGGADVYHKLAQYLDHQISKMVLGQTATTDAIAGGHAVGQEHNDVRGDIERADANQLEAVLARDIVRPLIDLNHGPQEAYPTVHIGRAEETDITKMSDALAKLVPIGLEVSVAEVRGKLGLEEPKKGDKILGAPPAAGGQDEDEDPPEPPDDDPDHGVEEEEDDADPPAPPQTAAARRVMAKDADDVLADRLDQSAAAAMGRMIDGVRAIVDKAESFEEIAQRLLKDSPDLSEDGLQEQLQLAMTVAEMSGRSDILDG